MLHLSGHTQMFNIETRIQYIVKNRMPILELSGMNITDAKLSAISEIWVNCETITCVDLSANKITTLENIIFPPCTKRLFLCGNQIITLQGFVVPSSLQFIESVLYNFCIRINNNIHRLWNNQISTLDGLLIPANVKELELVTE